MKFKTLFFFLFFLTNSFNAQKITGKVSKTNGEPLVFGNIIFKELNTDVIKDFTSINNGVYNIDLKNTYKDLLITIQSSEYEDFKDTIINISNKQTYTKNFTLKKPKTFEIKEVVLKKDLKKFEIKTDTVKYNVSAYRDGSEKKVEDILKKLPGIEINEKSGEIKYEGKSIETVNFEGDNLFGKNYTLGTKNINVDIVEQIEAIENYSENPLLKGLENNDKVALNIKLKKGKIDFSGNMDYASGLSSEKKEVYNITANLLGVNKNFKSFNTLSYNNIGVNNTPFDYFSSSKNLEQQNESNFITKKVIGENIFSSTINEARANLNNLLFANYNSIWKLGKRTSIKTNLYFINDKIDQKYSSSNKIFIDNKEISTSDDYSIQKKPILVRGDIEVKINTSKNSLLEYTLKTSQENINTNSTILQNNSFRYNTDLLSKSFTLNQNLLFTKRIKKDIALQLNLFHALNRIPQTLSAVPPFIIDSLNHFTTQYSGFRKSIIGLQSNVLGKTHGKNTYTLSVGLNSENTPYKSYLSGLNNSELVNNYSNNLNYKKNYIFTSGVYNFNIGDLKISPSYNFGYLNQSINDNLSFRKENIIFEPQIIVKYKINQISSVFGSASYNQKPFTEEYFFSKTVFINNRYNVSNVQSLELQKSQSYKLFYFINNLYKQFQLSFGTIYSKNSGNYFSDINISENITSTKYFFSKQPSDNFNVNFSTEKYLPVIETKAKISLNYGLSSYKNIINNSDIRNNDSQNFNLEFLLKTSFDFKINFENNFSFSQSSSRFEDSNAIQNIFLNNTSKIILKPFKKLLFIFSSDLFIPNTKKKNENYLFLDFSLKYNINKALELSFYGKNILNKKYFAQVETSDYSTSIFQSSLIPRYYMLNISFNY